MDDHTQDYYAILGVSKDATDKDIKMSYRRAARRFHPDVNNNEGATLQFTDITRAYEILSDPSRRTSYRQMRDRLAVEPQYFSVHATPSKRVLPILTEPQVIYTLVEIATNPSFTPETIPNSPMNLVLVLDRSKSMLQNSRLDRVKLAAHEIIDQLSEQDYLSLVVFSDRAEALILSEKVVDKPSLKALVNTMTANGGTEIYQGLSTGMKAARAHLDNDYVNHIILLTDGETFDDESLSIDLAEVASSLGIGISAMGIGAEWNDVFLDKITSVTGGYSAYINSPGAVVRFLNDRVRSLGSTFADRLKLTIAPDPDVKLESIFRLVPNPQPIEDISQPILLGALEYKRPVKLLIQLQIAAALEPKFRSLVRFDVNGDVLYAKRSGYKVISDLSVEASETPVVENPPRAILDALGKLTLHRMQQKAEDALVAGRFDEATRRLENLATRLLEHGQADLAQTVLLEAQRVKQTQSLSQEGRKTIKFGTRALLSSGDDQA